jgi:type II restriction enzyme
MANKDNLRKQRTGTIINNTSEKREGKAAVALGKNVVGFRTALLNESIFPFVCFGDGCDFAQDSSILDRVITISMFGKLNQIRVHNEGANGIFNRGSFYFREEKWTVKEMVSIMNDIAEKSIYYYFSKYGELKFK